MRWSGLAPALLLIVAGCGAGVEEEVFVLAASSLTDVFKELEHVFEETNPEYDIVLSHAGSATLREQVLGGAPVDVLASADRANMDQVANSGLLAGDAHLFAQNRLQIAVPPGNPAGVSGLENFAEEELLIGLCAVGVPCGDLGRQALHLVDVEPAIDTNEPNVRALLTKLETGELDAGIVYVTDVGSAKGRVEGIEISRSIDVTADYPIGIMTDAPNPPGAKAFTSFVLSEVGQDILQKHGFLTR